MHIEAVVFDFDGTLVHLNIDFGLMRQDVETLLAEHGIQPMALKGLLALEMIDEGSSRISEKDPVQGKVFYQNAHLVVTEREVRAARKGRILSGVIAMLKALRRRGVKVGIITRNCDKAVRIVFPDIECFCDAFIPRDSVTRVKPHPDHLIQAIKEMSIHHPERCLMVGDHPMDIEGGKRMGMKTAGVLTGRTTRQEFIKAGADLILDDATKIPGCIFEEQAK
jgi:phosphoglycolate phosphatase